MAKRKIKRRRRWAGLDSGQKGVVVSSPTPLGTGMEEAAGSGGFGPDSDRLPLAGGGVKRGEALQLVEEEDDFEDGRSSGGVTSRSQLDAWGGPDRTRAIDSNAAKFGVTGGLPGQAEREALGPFLARRRKKAAARPRKRAPKSYSQNA